MPFYQVTSLLAAIFHVVMAVLVLTRDYRAAVNRVCCGWGLCLAVWNLGAFFIHQVPEGNKAAGMFWAYFLHAGVILAPVTMCHLCFLIARVSWPTLLKVVYGVHVLLVASMFIPGWYIADLPFIPHHELGYYVRGGPGFKVYLFFYNVIAATTFYILWRKQRSLTHLHRVRLRALIAGNATLALFGTNDMMPLMGIYKYPLLEAPYYPTGGLAAIVFGLIVGYSVLQHHLLDIHLALSRAASYLVQYVFSLVTGFLLLAVVWLLVPGQFGGWGFLGAFLVLGVNTVITSLLFPRIFGRGRDILERRILGDRFEYHQELQRFSERIRTHPHPDTVVGELQGLLRDSMGVQSMQIIMRDETTQTFSLAHSFPDRLPGPISSLQDDAAIFAYFRGPNPGYLAYKIAYAMPGETELERKAREQFKEFDPEFCFPLFYEGRTFGFLLLGPRKDGAPYTPEDLRLLVEVACNLSLLLNQVRLKGQIQAAQEQELLGRMGRGLAHDLNNLITPARTFLQLCHQGLMTPEVIKDLLPLALKNVDVIRSYIDEALFFSRNRRLEFGPARVDEIIREAAGLAQQRLRGRRIEFRMFGLMPTVAEVDSVMVQRLLVNVLSNAIDASPEGAAVQIHLSRLPQADGSRDWVRIKVVDAGEGISSENLERVFKPYFTTKDRGDGTRGFGLGLAIARRIVQLHGGHLRIASVEKKGTTVEVDLPAKQAPTGAAPRFETERALAQR